MENTLISVIVPVYKVEKYLERCVSSLLCQTHAELEILLIDDGSPDGSGAICDELAKKDSRIRVFHKENGGLSSARNLGLEHARGEYISFIDSDDWIEPDSYENFLALMKKYDVKLVYGGNVDYWGDTGLETPALCPKVEECITGEELVRRMFLWDGVDSSACDKVYHRSLLEGVHYPLGVECEDVATTYKVALKTDRVAVYPKAFYHYFHRFGSISNSGVNDHTFDFAEHTLRMEPEILAVYPGLRDAVGYLKVRALAYAVQQLDISDKEIQKKYRLQEKKYRPLLRKEAKFIWESPLFSKKEKRDFLMIGYNIYKIPRAIYHIPRKMKAMLHE